MKRRKFLAKTPMALLGAGTLSSCVGENKSTNTGPYINFNKTYRWKLTTTWPPNFPVFGEGCQVMADWIRKMSVGRMDITVYGGGELIPTLEGFDAVRNGAVEMNHGAAYYWSGFIPSSSFFAAVPFGMNASQMGSWIISGGGAQLWEEIYDNYNVIPMLCGNTGIQMGGWYNKKIDSLEDLRGLKMRIPGLGAKVLSKAGGTPMRIAGGEIYTNLERGVIDATEWIGPYHDYTIGFHQIAKYYYYPGWHEPGAALELLINKKKFLELPSDLQEIIRTAAYRVNRWMGAECDAKNGLYLNKIRTESSVQVLPFPDEVLEGLKGYTKETLDELIEADPQSKKVYESFTNFKGQVSEWMDVSERIFYEKLMR